MFECGTGRIAYVTTLPPPHYIHHGIYFIWLAEIRDYMCCVKRVRHTLEWSDTRGHYCPVVCLRVWRSDRSIGSRFHLSRPEGLSLSEYHMQVLRDKVTGGGIGFRTACLVDTLSNRKINLIVSSCLCS